MTEDTEVVQFPNERPYSVRVLCLYCGLDLGRPDCARCNEWVRRLFEQGNTVAPIPVGIEQGAPGAPPERRNGEGQ